MELVPATIRLFRLSSVVQVLAFRVSSSTLPVDGHQQGLALQTKRDDHLRLAIELLEIEVLEQARLVLPCAAETLHTLNGTGEPGK